MKVVISATTVTRPIDARRWTDRLSGGIFARLEEWIVRREPIWGECYVILEGSVPRTKESPARHNQLDMVVAFRDRVALFEVKSYVFFSQTHLEKAAIQINSQVRWVDRLLEEYGFHVPKGAFRKYLLLTLQKPHELSQLNDWMEFPLSCPHIKAVGVSPGPHFLVDSLLNAGDWHAARIPPKFSGIQAFLHEKMTALDALPRIFSDFSEARAYLKAVPDTSQIPPDKWYQPNLRSDALNQSRGLLASPGIFEIVGPPGIGKSTLAIELFNNRDVDVLQIPLSDAKATIDIGRRIYTLLEGEPAGEVSEGELVQHLITPQQAFWISEYDERTAPVLDEFIQLIQRHYYSNPSAKATWVIESVSPRPSIAGRRIELGPLSLSDINLILAHVPTDRKAHDHEDIAKLSKGNPRRAIQMWQAIDGNAAMDSEGFSWFRRQLNPLEHQILKVLCVASSASPFGITARALSKLCESLFPYPHSDVLAAVDSLLLKLEHRQLAHIIRFSRNGFGGLLDAVIPDFAEMVVARDVSTGLVESEFKLFKPGDRERVANVFRDILFEIAASSRYTNSLAEVILGFALGSLEEFVRSSFRSSSLTQTLSWIERQQWNPVQPGHLYVLRGLRVLMRVFQDPALDFQAELELPEIGNALQEYIHDVVRARAASGHVNPKKPLEDLISDSSRSDNPDIVLESLIGLANAFERMSDEERPSRHRDAYDILDHLFERCALGTAARAFALQQLLAFLNRTKSWKEFLTPEKAFRAIQNYSRELIEEGLQAENLQLICDALFYVTRSIELSTARTASADIIGYRTVLRFIEAAQDRRGRRMQLLLTQGSVHRHFCGQELISWADFQQHMEDAFDCYGRALRSARVQRRVRYALDAISYSMDLCLKGLRFAENATDAEFLIDKARIIAARADEAEQDITENFKGSEAHGVLTMVRMAYPLVLYLSLLGESEPSPQSHERLSESFGWLCSELDDIVRSRHLENAPKAINSLRNRLTRLFRFGSRYGLNNHNLFRTVSAHIRSVLEITHPHPVRGRVSNWKNIFRDYALNSTIHARDDLSLVQLHVEEFVTLGKWIGYRIETLREILTSGGLLQEAGFSQKQIEGVMTMFQTVVDGRQF